RTPVFPRSARAPTVALPAICIAKAGRPFWQKVASICRPKFPVQKISTSARRWRRSFRCRTGKPKLCDPNRKSRSHKMSDEFFFDPDHEEGSRFELIPAGVYVAEVVETEITQPKSGDGNMLRLTWKITEGEYEGRPVWQTLCFQHSKEQTQTI